MPGAQVALAVNALPYFIIRYLSLSFDVLSGQSFKGLGKTEQYILANKTPFTCQKAAFILPLYRIRFFEPNGYDFCTLHTLPAKLDWHV